MEIAKAISIIRSLSEGVDPYTGEQYPADSPYQMPDTVRALHMVVMALEKQQNQLFDNRVCLAVQGSRGMMMKISDYLKSMMQIPQ